MPLLKASGWPTHPVKGLCQLGFTVTKNAPTVTSVSLTKKEGHCHLNRPSLV